MCLPEFYGNDKAMKAEADKGENTLVISAGEGEPVGPSSCSLPASWVLRQ